MARRRSRPVAWGAVLLAVLLATTTGSGAISAQGTLLGPGRSSLTNLLADNVGGAVPVAAAGESSRRGFWVVSTDGVVTALAGATFYGDIRDRPLPAAVIGISGTGHGRGYWLLASNGAVYNFGDARLYGSGAGLSSQQPAVQLVPTTDGKGYWVILRGGRVVPFGDARDYGSIAAAQGDPVVGMDGTNDGQGYWIATADARLYAFGDAERLAVPAAVRDRSRLVSIGHNPDEGGFWLLFTDGRAMTVGADGRSSVTNTASEPPALALVPSAVGPGYWIVYANGTTEARGGVTAVATRVAFAGRDALAGRVVTLDPGHNGRNYTDPSYIDHLVDAGGFMKPCNTTGTETDQGYTEAAFNFDVAVRLGALLRRQGATVVMTRNSNDGIGPCVDRRAAIASEAKSDVTLSIHADGATAWGRGFSVDVPELDRGYNDGIIGPSLLFGRDLVAALGAYTTMPVSDYTGVNGIVPRRDLAGLNLSKVPVALVECGNMRNVDDAGLQTSPGFRQEMADALDRAITEYLEAH